MIKKIITIILLFTVTSIAQDAGKTGISFLKIGTSAKNIAVSDIGLLNADLSSVYYNPAAINLLKSSTVQFTHQAWIQDMTSEIVNANLSIFGLPLAIGVNTTKISNFEIRTKPTASPDAIFNVSYFYGSLSSGFKLYNKLDFGFTIKYLYESLLSDDASGTGYDFGLIYSDLIDNLTIGASIRNLGSMDKLRNEKTKLPSDFIFNAIYNLNFSSTSLNFVPVLGVQKYIELDEVHFHIGSDIIYDNQFSIRFGYVTGFEAKGISAGAGIAWNSFNFDYAFTPFSYGIGNASTISVSYTFN